MKVAALFGIAILSVAAGAPASDDDTVVITAEFFDDAFAVYTGQYPITSLTVPLNAVNFEDDENVNDDNTNILVVFVEADINEKGEYDYKGLYTLKNGKATKILETGTDSAADNTDSSLVYLSATDGLYTYNDKTKAVEKYGTFTDSLIGVVKLNFSEELYVLTSDHVVYKVSDNGEKKVKIDAIQGAQKIVLDFSDNLYFYGEDKQPYVLTEDGVKKIEGLPANPNAVSLAKPPFVIEEGVIFVSDGKCFSIYNNGTSEKSEFELQAKPTASAMEATLIEYFAYNKKIYEYNILVILLGTTLEELKKFLENKTEEIQSIATRSRGTLKV